MISVHLLSLIRGAVTVSILASMEIVALSTTFCTFPNNKQHVTLACTNRTIIQIRDAYWAAHENSQDTSCDVQSGDCKVTFSEIVDVVRSCSGRTTCTYNITTPTLLTCTGATQKVTQIGHVDYQCISDNAIYNICKEKMDATRSAYISSPSYPEFVNSTTTGNCSCVIESRVSIGISLFSLDFDFNQWGSTKSCDVKVKYGNETSCRGRSQNWNALIAQNLNQSPMRISIWTALPTFHRFWLSYNASSEVTIFCGKGISSSFLQSTTSHLRTHDDITTSVHSSDRAPSADTVYYAQKFVTQKSDPKQDDEKVPVALALSAACMAAGTVAVTLLIYVKHKKCKVNKVGESTEKDSTQLR